MSNIVVDYDLIENALPTIGDLSKGCESLNTNVDTTTSDLESLGGKHDDCFGSSIGVLDMFSGFIKNLRIFIQLIGSTGIHNFNTA